MNKAKQKLALEIFFIKILIKLHKNLKKLENIWGKVMLNNTNGPNIICTNFYLVTSSYLKKGL